MDDPSGEAGPGVGRETADERLRVHGEVRQFAEGDDAERTEQLAVAQFRVGTQAERGEGGGLTLEVERDGVEGRADKVENVPERTHRNVNACFLLGLPLERLCESFPKLDAPAGRSPEGLVLPEPLVLCEEDGRWVRRVVEQEGAHPHADAVSERLRDPAVGAIRRVGGAHEWSRRGPAVG